MDSPSEARRRALELSERYVCPGKLETFRAAGVELVIGRREGYRIWDLDGRELLDLHLNGGTYSLGHRHPELLAALRDALESLDIGNHHFPSAARAELAAELARLTPGSLHYTVYASGGGEAIDVAIKSARYATGRRRVVSVEKGYHGHTGLALGAGDPRFQRPFHSEPPAGEFVQVPFNDLGAMEAALAGGDVAAVVLETIPATSGFPLPEPGYLPGVKALCERHGSAYVADEVQTGLGRTGRLWGVESFGVEPDALVTGKGLSGGLYPIAAAVLSPALGGWLRSDPFAHVSTFGGAEIGCRVAQQVLAISARAELLAHVRAISDYLGKGLDEIQTRHPFLLEIRRAGLVMGLRFDHPGGGVHMTRALFEAGVWAMFAGHDLSVLQFKPGLLVDERFCDELLERFETALTRCAAAL